MSDVGTEGTEKPKKAPAGFVARYDGRCYACGAEVKAGVTRITWSKRHKGRVWHFPTCDGQRRAVEAPAEVQAPAPAHRVSEPAQRPAQADLASILDSLSAAIVARLPKPELDEARVRVIAREVSAEGIDKALRLVESYVQKHATQTIKVERDGSPAVEIKNAHYLMPRLIRLLAAGLHVYLWGPAGSGKTTAALQAAEALGRTAEIDTLDPSTSKSAVMGYRNPVLITKDIAEDPELLARLLGVSKAETAFSRCWAGKPYIADECDNAPAHVQTLYNSALSNGHAPLAWGSVARGEGFLFIGTGNTPGRPTAAFPDRRPMSAAFADRLYFMYWPLDPAIECRAAGLPVPARPERRETTCTPAQWVTWVHGIRAWAAENAPTLQVTPRASLVGLQALAAGETPGEVAHGLVFRGADDALVTKALRAVPLP